jgi:leader peptidase (prepilin peptidase)/N-methyltransferase
VLAWLGVAALTGGAGDEWVRAAAAAAVCGAGFAVFPLVLGSRGYGFGDAKLALGVGALLGWLGWTAVVAGLFLAFLASGLVAATLLLARRVTWRDALPFGPYLVAGTLTALAWAGLS